MNSDSLIIYGLSYGSLTTKGSGLTNDEIDNNFIKIYKDFEALAISASVAAYDPATVYDNAINQFATYGGRVWRWIDAATGSGVTPVEGAKWTEISPSYMAHRKDSDLKLAEGTTDECSAAEIRAFIDAGLTTTTNLSISGHNNTNFLLESSTGADVTIPAATQFLSGLLVAADKIKLDNLSGRNTGDQTLASLNGESLDNKATDFLTINDTLYPSVQAVYNEIQSVLGSGSNIATSDLNLGTVATRKLVFNNAAASNVLAFRNSADTKSILSIQGDEKVRILEAYYLPTADGTSGQAITTDGSGNLSFSTITSTNIGNSNLTVSSAGTRSLTLGGNLASDLFLIQNNSTSVPCLEVRADATVVVGHNVSTKPKLYVDTVSNVGVFAGGTNSVLTLYGNGTTINTWNMKAGSNFTHDPSKQIRVIESGVGSCFIAGSNVQLVDTWTTHSGTYYQVLQNGTAPTTDRADKHSYYSADQAAGNACPHFRTESGQIVKLFSGAALTAADATATDGTIGTNDTITNNLRTRLNELEARLQAHGLIL